MKRIFTLFIAVLFCATVAMAQATVTSVTATSNQYYKSGQTVSITINFSAAIDFSKGSGQVQLALNSSGGALATLSSNTSNVTALVLTYTVAGGDNAAPLNYTGTGALTLTGTATIQDHGSSTNSTLTLPATSSGSALQASNVTIDTTPPTLTFTQPAASASVNNTKVTYTISESLSAGSITWLGTAGTDNGNSHAQSLSGTELTSNQTNYTLSSPPTLVNGSTYTVTFAGTDLAGNAATSVAHTGVIFDTTPPTLTLTQPATSSLVNNTKVTYTITESLSTGTITWTQTGGSADGSSPHIQSLSGTELTANQTNYTLSSPPTLVSGAIYTVTFAGSDLAGNAATTVSTTGVTFDNTPPTLTLTQPATNGYVNTANITYTVTENLSSGTITWTRTGGTTDSNSPHSVSLTGTELTANQTNHSTTNTFANALVSGTIYSVAFAGTDLAGNTATTITNTSVTFDTSAPAGFTTGVVASTGGTVVANFYNTTNTGVNVTVPIANDGSLTGGTIQIQATESVTNTYVNIGSPATILLANLGATQTVSLTSAQITAIANYGDGKTLNFQALITDVAGNGPTTGSPSATNLVVDITPPTLTLTQPATGSFVNNTKVTYTISGTLGSGTITWTRTGGAADGGSPHAQSLSGTELTANQTNHTLTSNPTLVSGTVYTVAFAGTDLAGNPATTITNTSVTYDTTNPTLTLTQPANNAFTNNTKVTYTISESLSSGTITWTQTGGSADAGSPHTQSLSGTELTANQTNYTLSSPPTLVDGAIYTVAFAGSDLAGNTGTTVTRTSVTYDVTPPTLTLTQPAPSSFVNTSKVTYTITESLSSGTITWTRTGGTADAGSPHAQSLSGGELTSNQTNHTLTSAPTLVSGTIYTVTFAGTDLAGNAATTITNTSVTFDTTNPTVTLTQPAANAYVNTAKVTYTVSESLSSGTIRWNRTGGTADGASPHNQALTGSELTTNETNYTLTNNPTLVNGAVYTVSFVTPTDLAGNVGTTVNNASVTYDTSPPAAFTLNATASTGGRVISGYYNTTNTGVGVSVNIANDASLTGGTIQIQATESVTNSFVNIGSAATILIANLGGKQTVNLTSGQITAIANYGDGKTLKFQALLTDAAGNGPTTSSASQSLVVDITPPTVSSGPTLTSNSGGGPSGGSRNGHEVIQFIASEPLYVSSTAATGTITSATNSSNVTGSGTLFTTEIQPLLSTYTLDLEDPGTAIGSTGTLGTINSVSNNTSLALTGHSNLALSGASYSYAIDALLGLSIGGSGSPVAIGTTNYISDGHTSAVDASVTNTKLVYVESSLNTSNWSTTNSTALIYTRSTGGSQSGTYLIDVAGNEMASFNLVCTSGSTTTMSTASNGVATSPMINSSSNQVVLAFSLVSTGANTLTAVSVNSSVDPTNLLSNFSLYANSGADNAALAITGGSLGTGTYNSGTGTIDFTGLSSALSTTTKYFYLVANVNSFFYSTAPTIQFSISASTGCTVSSGGRAGTDQTGTNYTLNDTTPPTVTSITNSVNPIYEGSLTQTVIVQYSEPMNTATTPNIVLSNGTWGAQTPVSGGTNGWFQTVYAGDTYKATFTQTGVQEIFPSVTSSVPASGNGHDWGGNANTTVATSSSFVLDTQKPTGTLTLTPSPITTNNLALTIKVVYSKTMNTGINPTINAFTSSSNFTPGAGTWSTTTNTNDTYTIVYTHNSVSETVTGISVTANAGKDADGNLQTVAASSTFNIDTQRPTASSINIITSQYTKGPTVQYLVTFSKTVSNVMSTDFTPVAVNGTVSTGSVSTAPTTSDGGLTYTVTVTGLTGDGDERLDLNTTGSITDVDGNVLNAGRTGDQVYTIDNTPPTVTSIALDPTLANAYSSTVNGFTPHLHSDSIRFVITFSEPVSGLDPSFKDFNGIPAPNPNNNAKINSNPKIIAVGGAPSNQWKVSAHWLYGAGTVEVDYDPAANAVLYTGSGTISVLSGQPKINASGGTNFTTQIPAITPGANIYDSQGSFIGTVAVGGVSSAALQLTNSANTSVPNANDPTGAFSYTLAPIINITPTGTLSSVSTVIYNGSTINYLNGSGTSFLTEVAPNDKILDGLGNTIGYVQAIVSNTKILLNNLGSGYSLGTYQISHTPSYSSAISDRAGNVITQTYKAGGSADIAEAEPVGAVTSLNPSPANTSVTVTWTDLARPNAVSIPAQNINYPGDSIKYLVMLKDASGTFITPANGTYNSNSSGTHLWVQNIGYGVQAATFTGLQSGTAYSAIIYPYTLDYYSIVGTDRTSIDYYTSTPATTNTSTTISSTSTLTAVLTAQNISSVDNAVGTKATAFKFSISDDALATLATDDNSPFKFSKLVINPGATNAISDWTTTIVGAQLADNNGNTQTITQTLSASGQINSTNLTFTNILSSSGSLGYISDNGTQTYTLYIWVSNPLVVADNTKLDFKVDNSSFTGNYDNTSNGTSGNPQASSQLDSAPTQSVSSGSDPITVVASKMVVITQPPATIGVGSNFPASVAPKFYAEDANGNQDLDYNNSVTISNSQNDTQSTNAVTFTSGQLLLTAYNFTSTNTLNTTIKLDGTAGSPATGTVTTGNVLPVISSKSTITAGSGLQTSISSLTTAQTGAVAPQKNAVQNFSFTITDDFGANTSTFADNDALPTKIQTLVISQDGANGGNGTAPMNTLFNDWTNSIAGASLYDGTTTITGVIGATTITFSSMLPNGNSSDIGYVPDSNTKTYYLSVWLKNPILNGLAAGLDDQDYVFDANTTGITLTGASNVSSTLAASTVNSGNTNNTVRVFTTKLSYTTQPPPSGTNNYLVNVSLGSASQTQSGGIIPVVEALDVNGNRDVDYSAAVTPTTTGVTFSTAPSTFTSGIITSATFANMVFTSIGVSQKLSITSSTSNGDIFSAPLIPTATQSNAFDVKVGTATTISNPLEINTGAVSSIANTSGQAVQVFSFKIIDDGATPPDDGNPTLISGVTFKPSSVNDATYLTDWTQAIAGATLSDNLGHTVNGTINAPVLPATPTTISFTSMLTSPTPVSTDIGYIPDGGPNGAPLATSSKTYTLSIWLKSSLSAALQASIDGKKFGFEIASSSDITTNVNGTSIGSGSGIPPSPVGNKVDVEATEIDFTTEPASSLSTYTDVTSSSPLVDIMLAARDVNQNTDLDYQGNLGNVTNSGTTGSSYVPTGTITTSTSSTTVTGVGTLFTTELVVGAVLKNSSGLVLGTVQSISSNTSLTLVSNAAVAVSGGTYIYAELEMVNIPSSHFINGVYSMLNQAPNLQFYEDSGLEPGASNSTGTGTITSILVSTNVIGVGTSFLTELSVGSIVKNSSGTVIGTVASISSNTSLTLTAGAALAVTSSTYKYDDPTQTVRLKVPVTTNNAIGALPTTAVSTPFSVLGSYQSWLHFDQTVSNYTSQIDFVNNVASTTNSGSIALANVILNDGGAPGFPATDADGAYTKISNFTFTLQNASDLSAIGLYTVSGGLIDEIQNPSGTVTLGSSGNSFNTNPLVNFPAPDNQSITYIIRAEFKQNIIDQHQIVMQLTGVTHAAGSNFPENNPTTPSVGDIGGNAVGSANLSTPGTVDYINVIATSLDFTTQPSAFAGKNEPINSVNLSGGGLEHTGVVYAQDKFQNLDTNFSYTYGISAPAGPVSYPNAFISGKLDLTGMEYNGVGDGTLTITAFEPMHGVTLNSNSSINSAACNHVDVIDVTAVKNNTGVSTVANLKGGKTATIFGFDITSAYSTSTDPQLQSFVIKFDTAFQTSTYTSYTLTGFSVSEGTVNPQNVVQAYGATVVPGRADPVNHPNNYDLLTVTFPTPRPLTTGTVQTRSYFINATVSSTANSKNPAITAQLLDNGYNDQRISITQGSAHASVIGNKYGFASTNPPSLLGAQCVPYTGQLNVDKSITEIDLVFDVSVFTFDGKAQLWNRSTRTQVADLTAINGNYIPNTSFSSLTVKPLRFAINWKPGRAFQTDSVYYVTIPKGNYDPTTPSNNSGISDDQTNLYGGISSDAVLYFKIVSDYPPKMLNTDPQSYFMSSNLVSINASFDQKGVAYYLILDHSKYSSAPTSADIKNPATNFSSALISYGNDTIRSLDPVLQYFNATPSLPITSFNSSVAQYDVWLYAENDATVPYFSLLPYGKAPSYVAGGTGPTYTFTYSPTAATTVPNYQICPGANVVLSEPIVITESVASKWGIGSQNFNVLLPTGFNFDTGWKPTIQLIGADFGGTTASTSYINSTLLNVSFTNSGTASIDQIIISDMSVQASSATVAGPIEKFGGNGIIDVPDQTKLAQISGLVITPYSFTNSFTAYNQNNFVGGLKISSVATSIPDNYLDRTNSSANPPNTVTLSPVITQPNDYYASTFSGSGVTDDVLSLSAVSKGVAFGITIDHDNQDGCPLSETDNYTVYDHTQILPKVTNLNMNDPNTGQPSSPSYLVNYLDKIGLRNNQYVIPSDVGNKGPAGSIMPLASFNSGDIGGYQMDSLIVRIPLEATPLGTGLSTDQIIADVPVNGKQNGGPWQTQLSKILQGTTLSTTTANSPYPRYQMNYTWDFAPILNATSVGLPDPYSSGNFKQNQADPSGYYSTPQTFYTGGSLGLVDFIGRFQNTADNTIYQPLVQRVELWVPPLPVILVSGGQSTVIPATSTTPDIFVFCEYGNDFVINGYPVVQPGQSTGSFQLFDDASNTPFTGSGFTDNQNGTASFSPKSAAVNGVRNGYKTIRVEYTYKDNNSPISGTGKFYIQIAPNPAAAFTESSIGPNASIPTALCQGNRINFSATTSQIASSTNINGAPITPSDIKSYAWNFGDTHTTGLLGVDTTSNVYALSSSYQVSLTLVSKFGCSSTQAIGNSTVTPTVASVLVGEIPVPNFAVTKNCVTDLIAFDASGSKMPSLSSSNSSIPSSGYAWNYNFQGASNKYNGNNLPDPTPTTGGIGGTAKYSKPGFYDVLLTVTSSIGCKDTVSKPISILDNVNPFNEYFDNGTSTWQAVDLNTNNLTGFFNPVFGPSSKVSWALGQSTVRKDTTYTSIPANKLWTTSAPRITDAQGRYFAKENSAIITPCLNLDPAIVPRPMISYSSFIDVAIGDGLVLQYSTDDYNVLDPKKVWNNVGTIGDGLDWFTSNGLPSNPGNTSGTNAGGFGWSGHGDKDGTDTTFHKWIHPKHALDIVSGTTPVILRFALASAQSNTYNHDGIGIDSVFFGSRTRTILFENFTTTDGAGVYVDSALFNEASYIQQFVQANVASTQLVNINYHVGFVGQDPFNLDNPADPAARAVFYGVNKVPYAFLDGVHYTGTGPVADIDRFRNWGQKEYALNTLVLANADFSGTVVTPNPDGTVDITVNFVPLVTGMPTGINGATLQVAILDKVVSPKPTYGTVSTGETSFYYVFKQFLPSAAGQSFSSLNYNVPVSLPKMTYNLSHHHSDVLTVVIFLQDATSKTVYQAYQTDVALPTVITGIEPTPENMKVYPNPADQELVIELPSPVRDVTSVRLANQLGVFFDFGTMAEGEQRKTISTGSLSEGVYILQLGAGNTAVRSKVVVLHK